MGLKIQNPGCNCCAADCVFTNTTGDLTSDAFGMFNPAWNSQNSWTYVAAGTLRWTRVGASLFDSYYQIFDFSTMNTTSIQLASDIKRHTTLSINHGIGISHTVPMNTWRLQARYTLNDYLMNHNGLNNSTTFGPSSTGTHTLQIQVTKLTTNSWRSCFWSDGTLLGTFTDSLVWPPASTDKLHHGYIINAQSAGTQTGEVDNYAINHST